MIFQNQDTIYACVVHVGELLDIEDLKKAYNHVAFKLNQGESKVLSVSGLFTVTNLTINYDPYVGLVSKGSKIIYKIAGRDAGDISIKFDFEDNGDVRVTSLYGGTCVIHISYQSNY